MKKKLLVKALSCQLLAFALLASALRAQVPSDPATDNGPLISAALRDGACELEARDYYVASTIQWPKRNGGRLSGAGGYTALLRRPNVGVTRLIWNGPPGGTMIEGAISGGRIEQLVIQGGLKAGPRAGIGIRLLNQSPPPTGFTVLDQVAYCNLDRGFAVADEPEKGAGNSITHIAPIWHGVRIPYSVSTQQSVCHTIFAGVVKAGFERVFEFAEGGPLNVYGLYVGATDGGTLLHLGRTTSTFAIQGLNVDGNAKNFVYVSHGKYGGRVRIEGMVAKSATEGEIVVEREGPTKYADVQIDCTNGVVWPPREAP